ncbi:MAG: carbohydrate-binding domain-containing protein, partial [Bacteroidaceae bacterium]|nr:carbohydrate-binding domain-containing protein [Bacteroidaceae bacterium]
MPFGKQKYNGSSKGVRVANTITINGGKLNVKTSAAGAEALEGKKGITFNGGEVSLYSKDDAINSSGKIVFNGGKISAVSTGNDAVDSNSQSKGAITINGGELDIVSLCGSPEEGLDCDWNPMVVTGGKVYSMGGAMSGSPSAPSEKTAKQPTVVINGIDYKEGQAVTIVDDKGKAVITFVPKYSQQASHSLITSPDFKVGKSYKVMVDGKAVHEFTFESTFTTVGESGGFGGFGG